MFSENNPIVTFILFVYNQERFIHEAIEGAISQQYSPLEIIISDDFSVDNSYNIIKKMVTNYQGPHSIIIRRNLRNLGVAEHINSVLRIAHGELIIAAAGDDISIPCRTTLAVNAWIKSGKKAKAIFSNAIIIDNNGLHRGVFFKSKPLFSRNITDFLEHKKRIFRGTPPAWVLGATNVFEKSLFDVYGPLHSRIIQEDGAISFRALLQGEIIYLDECLVNYRQHSSNTFQPNNSAKVLNLLRSEYYYKKSWLKDAFTTHKSDKYLLLILFSILFKSFIMHIIIITPFIGISIIKIKLFLKNYYKNRPEIYS